METASFSSYRVNPPLIRTIAAIPCAIVGYEADWSFFNSEVLGRPEFDMGELFVQLNGHRTIWLTILARWTLIPFMLLGTWICYRWASELFGRGAGYMASLLWIISPMPLAHGALIAPDAHSSALGLAACYTFWRWLKRPTWSQAIVTGVVLGVAELAKSTLIIFYPVWPLLWIAYRLPIVSQMTLKRWTREAGMLAIRMLVGLYVLNLGYLGEGSFARLANYQFVSELFGGQDVTQGAVLGNRFADTWVAPARVPLPSNFVQGIDAQQKDFEHWGRPSYLRGEFQEPGWWYYYLYAVAVKTPLGTLGLIALTVVLRATPLGPRIYVGDSIVLLTPALVIFVVASMKTGINHHARYILPCIPFVFVWISQLAVHVEFAGRLVIARLQRSARTPTPRPRSYARATVGVATTLMLAATFARSIAVFPHSIACFNGLIGGPHNGPRHLLNSNIDWGQDLLHLDRWIKENVEDETTVFLAFYNYYNPFDLGIDQIEPWPFERPRHTSESSRVAGPGYYALSVNLLFGTEWPVRDRDGRQYAIDNRVTGRLRDLEPVGRAGFSIWIYSQSQVESVIRERSIGR